MGFDRVQLKRSVKLSMKGTSSRPMLVTLAFSAIVSVGTGLINAILGRLLTGDAGSLSDALMRNFQLGYELEEAVYIAMLELFRRGPGAMFGAIVGGSVLSILIALWQSTMNVGYKGYCLSMVRNENPPLDKVFCALPQFGPVLVTRILTEVFEVLWLLLLCAGFFVLAFAGGMLAAIMDSVALMLLSTVVLGIALWAGVVWITLRYALVDYVLLDKGLTGMDAIRESKRLMRGRTGQAFVLQLSFIGWYLLLFLLIYVAFVSALTAALSVFTPLSGGVGGTALLIMVVSAIAAVVLSLRLRPYATGALAKFYDWANGGSDGFTGGSGYGGSAGGWSQPTDYTWSSGNNSGSGIGAGPRNDGPAPKPPKPKDDPWN